MKKILFLIPTLGGGGAEKVLVNLVNSLDKTKFKITVITLFADGVNAQYLDQNIEYKSIFRRQFRGNSHILKLFSPHFLYKRMIKGQYDTIISFLEGPTTRIVSGCDKDTKLIAWIHTEKSSDYVSSFRSYKEMIDSHKKFSNIICVSDNVKANFDKFTKNQFTKKNSVIKNIINFKEIERLAKEKVEKDSSKFRILCIGRLTKVKDFSRMLDILYKLNTKLDNLELLILGTGPEEENLKKKIKELNLTNVQMLGYQENPYKFLASADLYVCSSHFEGFSTSTTEAVILNKPIVTTDCSGMKDLLENGDCGIIVDDNDKQLYEAMLRVITDDKIRHDIINCQQEKITKMKKQRKADLDAIEKEL